MSSRSTIGMRKTKVAMSDKMWRQWCSVVGSDELPSRLADDLAPDAQTVYFIQRGAEGPIKIGIALSPQRRRASLQTASPERLVLLGVRAGGRKLEQLLHWYFEADRLEGEWFRPTPELIDHIVWRAA